MPRNATVAPQICVTEPTVTSMNGIVGKPVGRPVVKVERQRSKCERNCRHIVRTILAILALTAGGLAMNFFFHKEDYQRKSPT